MIYDIEHGRSIIGIVKFKGLFPGMCKARDFIVYPTKTGDTRIKVQSDTHIGWIDLPTGRAVMKAPKSQKASGVAFVLPEGDRQALATAISRLPGDGTATLVGGA